MSRLGMKKFNGNFKELQQCVLLAGIFGIWEDKGNHKTYRADNGAVLNWWMSTKTISFQGQHQGAKELEHALLHVGKQIMHAKARHRYEVGADARDEATRIVRKYNQKIIGFHDSE